MNSSYRTTQRTGPVPRAWLSLLTNFCPPFQHLLSERLTSLGIMGEPRVPPLNYSETIVLWEHLKPLWEHYKNGLKILATNDVGVPGEKVMSVASPGLHSIEAQHPGGVQHLRRNWLCAKFASYFSRLNVIGIDAEISCVSINILQGFQHQISGLAGLNQMD